MNNALVAFFCGMMSGGVVGVLLFSVILAIRANDDRRERDNDG